MEPQSPTATQQSRTPGVMSWDESINYFVGKGKIGKAGIYDTGGKQLAGSENLQVSDQDIRSIEHCVSLPVDKFHKVRFGIFIEQVRYICFKVDSKTLIGVSREDLFVAHMCDNVLILAYIPLGVEETNVSCLGEVWTFAEELKSHMAVSQLVQ